MAARSMLDGFLGVIALTQLGSAVLPWPYRPGTSSYEIGNNYGEFQHYDGHCPYYHDGLDILAGRPRRLEAIEAGTVTHVTDDRGGLYTGVMIGDPVLGGEGWAYWHIDSKSLKVNEGDVVAAGQHIGDVVKWPVHGFHHVHLSKVRGTGGYPWRWYVAIGNPLASLTPNRDDGFPVVEKAAPDARFLFCENETGNYLEPDQLTGRVDIIARVRDTFGASSTWGLLPYEVHLRVTRERDGQVVLERSPAFRFEGELGESDMVTKTVFKDDSVADSRGDYSRRIFHVVVTNSDGDLAIEPTDRNESWDTTTCENGRYVVTVSVGDMSGNEDSRPMLVVVDN